MAGRGNLLDPPYVEPDSSFEHRRRHPLSAAKAAWVAVEVNAVEPPAYLGAVGIFALTGLAALLTAPFRSSTYRKAKPVPPVRHPTTW